MFKVIDCDQRKDGVSSVKYDERLFHFHVHELCS